MKNNIIVISGSAGTGKGTIVKYLKENSDYFFSISTTTRAVRGDDIPGETYNFVTENEFKKMIENGDFLEYAKYSSGYYGTPKPPINKALAEGKNVILEIETQGAMKVKQQYPQATMIWITPPDRATLEKRLRNRGTNTEEEIISRLEIAKKELEMLDNYDYIVINNDGEVEAAAKQVMAIIASEELLVSRNETFTEEFYR